MIINGYEIEANTDLRYSNLRNADLRNADLRYSNLRYSNLRNADLRYSNLRYSNLRNADLQGADLRNADLRNADLQGSYLQDANLQDANLQGVYLLNANLQGADLLNADLRYLVSGNNREIKTIQLGEWQIVITKTEMSIGCQHHPITEWFSFNDNVINEMSDNALGWWNKNKQILKLITDNNNDN